MVLRSYQSVGSSFIKKHAKRGVFNNDQPRLGKTVQAVSAWTEFPVVIVAPLSTKRVWQTWTKNIWPDARFYVAEGQNCEKDLLQDVYFIHYNLLPYWVPLIEALKPHTIVFDEIHILSSRDAERTQAATVAACYAKERVGLTGTPLWNSTSGLYPILKMIRGGREWGSYTDFVVEYCSASFSEYGLKLGETNSFAATKLKEKIKEFSIRRVWTDVAEELPKVDRRITSVNINRKLSAELDLEVFDETKPAIIAYYSKLRSKIGKQKIGTSIDVIRKYSEPTVVWFWNRSVGTKIAEAVGGYYIDGRVDNSKRDEIFDAWNDSDRPLVISLGIGQVGIDLSHSEVAIFSEFDYTPAVISQAEMRTFSPNAKKLSIEYIVADHHSERMMLGIIAAKCANAFKLGIPASDVDLSGLLNGFDFDSTEGDLQRLLESL